MSCHTSGPITGSPDSLELQLADCLPSVAGPGCVLALPRAGTLGLSAESQARAIVRMVFNRLGKSVSTCESEWSGQLEKVIGRKNNDAHLVEAGYSLGVCFIEVFLLSNPSVLDGHVGGVT